MTSPSKHKAYSDPLSSTTPCRPSFPPPCLSQQPIPTLRCSVRLSCLGKYQHFASCGAAVNGKTSEQISFLRLILPCISDSSKTTSFF
ncbi:hypothetical protein BC829DRAFT_253571 [Chytridium lagenaria]|nr:hypothetical protein BC829DRAFT_253571 [Chytridium lagenaria]